MRAGVATLIGKSEHQLH